MARFVNRASLPGGIVTREGILSELRHTAKDSSFQTDDGRSYVWDRMGELLTRGSLPEMASFHMYRLQVGEALPWGHRLIAVPLDNCRSQPR